MGLSRRDADADAMPSWQVNSRDRALVLVAWLEESGTPLTHRQVEVLVMTVATEYQLGVSRGRGLVKTPP